MRKIVPRKIYFLPFSFLLLLLTCKVQAQNVDAQKAFSLIQKNIAASGLTEADLQNSRVSDAYIDKISGATLVYLQQTYQGVDVDKHIRVFAFKNDALISALGKRYPINLNYATKVVTAIPAISATDAVRAAASKLNIVISSLAAPVSAKPDAAKETSFGNVGKISNVSAKLIWATDQKGLSSKIAFKELILCWAVNLAPDDSVNAWRVKVDAASGKVIGKENYTVSDNWGNKRSAKSLYTVENTYANLFNKANFGAGGAGINSASYRVVKFPAEAPSFPGGTPTIHTNPWDLSGAGNNATTLKWNYDGTYTFDSTRGNNVWAQVNWNSPNSLTPVADGAAYSSTPAPDLKFDFVPDFSQQPTDSANRNFAVTNLFYWNNIMHDISYQYGFDEVSGNFQQNNLNRGGVGNDYVVAFAQDGKGVSPYANNANFYTPADGSLPRMRMYLFDAQASTTTAALTINKPSVLKGDKLSVEGAFSINNLLADVGPVTANVALYTDDTASTSHIACVAPSNPDELKGKIALVYRGGCDFVTKVKDAENAGAVAVIVVDNTVEAPFIMGGDDNSITIPAVMVTLGTGDSIRTQLINGTAVNATLKKPVGIKLDGDLDAGVMCHEYTHGISNRFTGGPSNVSCLFNTEQMGEGWSDYDALMFTTDWKKATVNDGAKPRPVGTYVEGQPNNGAGIRNYPYSTDMRVDPWSYEYMKATGGEPHNVGEVWCTVLWDMTWNIIQMDGINTNIFNANAAGGNSIALKLVYEGMKLQACSPGFIDGRDAILKADTMLYNGKYSCAIWNAFAKRGMGLTASEGSSDVIGDETISHSTSGLLITKHVDKDSAAQGEALTYKIVVKAIGVCGVTTVAGSVVDTLPKNTTYVTGSGGTYNASAKTVTFAGSAIAVGDSVIYTFKATVNNGTYFAADTLFRDNPAKKVTNLWKIGTNWSYDNYGTTASPEWAYLASDVNTTTNTSLTTKTTYLVPGMQTTLSFLNYITTYYTGYNGGVVELTADGGSTWQDLGPYMSGFGYNSTISDALGSILAGRDAFSGESQGITTIDLSSFAGKKVKIRFRFVTTAGAGGPSGYGWYVEDILLKAQAAVNNVAKTSLNTSSSAYTVIKAQVLPVTWESFTATKQKNNALLEWTTAQEINSASFDVERSSDGMSFTKLGSQQAAGSSTVKHDYSFVDETPLQGLNIYRIKQIDNDGKFTYSVYRPLTFDNAPAFSVTPNPAKDKVKVTVTGNTKLLHVYVMSSTGQQLKSFEMTGETKDLNLPSLASGVYHIIVKGDGVSYKKKIVIQ